MGQDWFSANAPPASSDDWFSANVGPKPVPSHAGPSAGPDTPQHPHARVGAFVMNNLPTIASGAAALAAPESLLVRPLVAGGAGYLGARVQGRDRGDAAMEGLKQGGMELAGGAIGKGLAAGAERVYSGLLKPAKAIRDSFPNVARTALNERAMITKGGLSKITDRMARSRGDAMALIQDAEAIGTPGVTGQQAMSEFPDVVKELRKRADIGQRSELPRVGERGKALMKTASRGPDIPLTRAQQLKETAQDAASGAYRQLERGGSKQLSADDLLDKATATGLRKGIESRVPAVAAQNARTQELIGPSRAIEDALERERSNLGFGGFRDMLALGGGAAGTAVGGPGAGAATGLLMRALATPSTGSAMAIGANEIAKLPIAQLLRMAQMQALQDDQ